jgi:hypothetical protein
MMVATPTPSVDESRRRSRLFGLLLIALVLVVGLPLPFRMAGLVFGAAAMWCGVQALIAINRVRRLGGKASGQVAVPAGIGLASVLMVILLSEAALYPLVAEQEACMARAATITAERECADRFRDRQQELIDRLLSRNRG